MTTRVEAKVVLDPEQQLEDLALKAMRGLAEFLESEEENPAAIARARIGTTLVASWARAKQAHGARDALQFSMARELARDKDELRRYIELSMPASPLVRALPVPATPQD